MSDPDLSSWDYAGTVGATAPVLKELKKAKLSVGAIARLEAAMERVAAGGTLPGEASLVRDGVWELRVTADKRWYRLLFGQHDGRWVALLFAVKKRNDLDKAWIETALKRLREHKRP